MPIGRPRWRGFKLENDDQKQRRKVQRLIDNTTRGHGSSFPPIGDQFVANDPLICRWLRSSYFYEAPKTLEYYRDALDRQREDQFTWTPYTEEMLQIIPFWRLLNEAVCMASVPMVCFDIVEWHRPERVMRQFGLPQHVPGVCDNLLSLHKLDRTEKMERDWKIVHAEYIALWDKRSNFIVQNCVGHLNPSTVHATYMSWYKRITRRFISPLSRPAIGEYQPISHDLYMMGQFVPPERSDIIRQSSVDQSFYLSQQSTSRATYDASGYPGSSTPSYMPPNVHSNMSYPMDHQMNPTMQSHMSYPMPPPMNPIMQSHMSYPMPPPMNPVMPPPMSYPMTSTPVSFVRRPSTSTSHFSMSLSSTQEFEPTPPYQSSWTPTLSEYGDYGWASESSSQFPPNAYNSPTRPPSRHFTREHNLYDPSLSCVREQDEDSDEDEDDEQDSSSENEDDEE